MPDNFMSEMYLQDNWLTNPSEEANRVGFGAGLVSAAKLDENIVGLCADLTDSVKMGDFAKNYPKRFFEMGVAEQNMAGVAAGLALAGKVPFMASYAAFSPGRNFDQIRVSIAYSQNNVKIVGAHGGVSVGPDGATHQMLVDIAMMRSLPNMVVVVPSDYDQTYQATLAAAKHIGPVYLRLGREKIAQFTTSKTPFEIGKVNLYKEGTDVTIIANGIMVYEALVAAVELKKIGISAEVIECHTVKPLDEHAILKSSAKTRAVVTAEEAQINGGLGGAIAELLSENLPVPLQRVGVLDRFGETGQAFELMKALGLTSKTIITACQNVIERKNYDA